MFNIFLLFFIILLNYKILHCIYTVSITSLNMSWPLRSEIWPISKRTIYHFRKKRTARNNWSLQRNQFCGISINNTEAKVMVNWKALSILKCIIGQYIINYSKLLFCGIKPVGIHNTFLTFIYFKTVTL